MRAQFGRVIRENPCAYAILLISDCTYPDLNNTISIGISQGFRDFLALKRSCLYPDCAYPILTVISPVSLISEEYYNTASLSSRIMSKSRRKVDRQNSRNYGAYLMEFHLNEQIEIKPNLTTGSPPNSWAFHFLNILFSIFRQPRKSDLWSVSDGKKLKTAGIHTAVFCIEP